jgi:hypothetical protein
MRFKGRIVFDKRLDRPNKVRKIGLAAVMKKSRKLHTGTVPSGGSFQSAVD